ncbi:MAG: cation:proton antiporter [Candidatus Methylomirabilis oxyfera]|nr:cation:proton antiporter [Candidatus Methylomirabilis oxyfera]
MMPEFPFFRDLVLAIGAALLGGVVAQRLGQPPLLGYLVGGILIGPHTPGPVSDTHHVSALAEIGVVLLMFEIGVEFPVARLRRVRAVAIGGGVLALLLIGAIAMTIGRALGFPLVQQVFFGAIMSLASTMVALKMLLDRGEMDTPHGEIAVGITLVEDICLITMLVLLPAWAAAGEDVVSPLLLAMGKTLALLMSAYFVGGRLLPALFAAVVRLRSRELFLLTVVLVVIGTAVGLAALGLSPALGAYLAGVVVSRSHYSRQVLAELVPSRDLFASLFFVSVGMLVNPVLLWQHPGTLLAIVGTITLLRPLILASVVRAFGYTGRTAIMTGLVLAQIGELSFVLAKLGVDRRFITEDLYGLVLGGALISILMNPLLLRHGAPLLVGRLGREAATLKLPEAPPVETSGLANHIVICGCGRVGGEMVAQLKTQGIPYVVIELNPIRVDELRLQGEPCLFGDASNHFILKAAGVGRAKLLAITHYDATAAEVTIKEALQIRPSLEVIARAHDSIELERLRDAGASEVVIPEFEAGMEFLRWTLEHLGASAAQAETLIQRRRAEFRPN